MRPGGLRLLGREWAFQAETLPASRAVRGRTNGAELHLRVTNQLDLHAPVEARSSTAGRHRHEVAHRIHPDTFDNHVEPKPTDVVSGFEVPDGYQHSDDLTAKARATSSVSPWRDQHYGLVAHNPGHGTGGAANGAPKGRGWGQSSSDGVGQVGVEGLDPPTSSL